MTGTVNQQNAGIYNVMTVRGQAYNWFRIVDTRNNTIVHAFRRPVTDNLLVCHQECYDWIDLHTK